MVKNQKILLPPSPQTQLVQQIHDAASHAILFNQQDRHRYVGDILETKYFPLATFAIMEGAGATLGSPMGNGWAIAGGTLVGVVAHLTRFPNLLFGNGRYHGFSRGRKKTNDLYLIGKITDRYLTSQHLIDQLENGKFAPLTQAEKSACLEGIDIIIDNLGKTEKRNDKRNKTEFYADNTTRMEEAKDDVQKLKKLTRRHRIKRKEHIKYKIRDLFAGTRSAKEAGEAFGKTGASELAYLVDPNREKPSEENKETQIRKPDDKQEQEQQIFLLFGKQYIEQNGLLVPLQDSKNAKEETPQLDDDSQQDRTKSDEQKYRNWDPEVLDIIHKKVKSAENFAISYQRLFKDLHDRISVLPVREISKNPARERGWFPPIFRRSSQQESQPPTIISPEQNTREIPEI